MRKIIFLGLFFLGVIASCYSQSIVNGGNVYGKWEKSKSPYYVNGDIQIPDQQTLIIEAGVKVLFKGHFMLNILGSLQAIGNVSDSILFSSSEESIRWSGIRLDDVLTTNEVSRLSYCIIEKGYAYSGMLPNAYGPRDLGGGIYVSDSKLELSNSIIRKNKAFGGGGVHSNWGVKILNTKIVNNDATTCGGIVIGENSQVIGCVISSNTANEYAGIIVGPDAFLANNTICFNKVKVKGSAAVYITGSSNFVNNIFYYNIPATIYVTDDYGSPTFRYNNIEKGINGIIDYKPSLLGLFNGIFEQNIEFPPEFIDTLHNDFRLKNSPCINTGDPQFSYVGYQFDIDGNSRVYNDVDKRIDIGAYEYQGATPNRRPFIYKSDERYFLKNTNNIVKQNYIDVDQNDSHTITITSKDSNVELALIDSTNGSIITSVKPKPGWSGSFYLCTKVKDNSNVDNSEIIDSIKVNISRQFKGKIETNIVFYDTVEVIGNIVVMENGGLTIKSGTYVEFQDCCVLNVLGQLKILGKAEQKVVLNAKDSSFYSTTQADLPKEHGWGGIIIQKQNQQDTILIDYCAFKNTGQSTVVMNSYDFPPGTLTIRNSSDIAINNCLFESNYPVSQNAGVAVYNSKSISINNCTFRNGRGSYFEGLYVYSENTTVLIDKCIFENGHSYRSLIYGDYISLDNSVIANNYCYEVVTSPNFKMENCLVYNNRGGVYVGSDCLIRNNYFISSFNYSDGALQINSSKGIPYIVNNIFAYNDAVRDQTEHRSSAISLRWSSAVVANNTFVGNRTKSNCKAVYSEFCSPLIVNNIFWNNDYEGFGFYNGGGSTIPNPIVKNNLIRGGYSINGGLANIDANPFFRMNDSLDFTLTNLSLCINNGLNDTVGLHLGTKDILGNKRIDSIYHKIDIGAYEYTGNDVINSIIPLISNSSTIEIYPNPANSFIYLPEEFNNYQFKIVIMNFGVVRSGILRNSSINIEDLPNGFYIICFTKNNKNYSSSFVKQ